MIMTVTADVALMASVGRPNVHRTVTVVRGGSVTLEYASMVHAALMITIAQMAIYVKDSLVYRESALMIMNVACVRSV